MKPPTLFQILIITITGLAILGSALLWHSFKHITPINFADNTDTLSSPQDAPSAAESTRVSSEHPPIHPSTHPSIHPTTHPPTLVFGDIRGYFEPCGCNPATDLGGMVRLGGMINLQQLNHPDLEVLSVGNNFHSHEFRTEDRFIQQSLELIQPTAMLLGLTEWRHLHQLTADQQQTYLITHHQLRKLGFNQLLLTKHSVIFGLHYTRSESSLRLSDADYDFIAHHRHKHPTKRSVLLLATENPTEFFAEFSSWLPLFDLIILSHPQSLTTTQISPPTQRPAQAIALYSELQVPIYSATLAGGALLALNFKPQSLPIPSTAFTSSAEQMTSPLLNSQLQSSSEFSPPSTPDTTGGFYLWLTNTQPLSQMMQPLEAEYRSTKTQEFAATVTARLAELPHSPYVGSASCAGCHSSAYTIWQNSAHSSAFATLVAEHQNTNALCVSCHVVDLHQPGGFIAADYTPHLQGVGCESCHGPRRQHILKFHDPSAAPLSASAQVTRDPWNCAGCHHPPHVIDFDRTQWWQQIKHGY